LPPSPAVVEGPSEISAGELLASKKTNYMHPIARSTSGAIKGLAQCDNTLTSICGKALHAPPCVASFLVLYYTHGPPS
jgi:hypothetical protein